MLFEAIILKYELSDAQDDIHAAAGMLRAGFISEDEFQTKKRKIKSRLTAPWWKFW